jgi:hypothetical protein
VDQTEAVGRVDRLRHLLQEQDPLLEAELPGRRVQRPALHELHGDVGEAARFADLVDLADVGVVHARLDLRLPDQARRQVRMRDLDDLEGHEALQPRIVGLEDLRCAAPAQPARELEQVPRSVGPFP